MGSVRRKRHLCRAARLVLASAVELPQPHALHNEPPALCAMEFLPLHRAHHSGHIRHLDQQSRALLRHSAARIHLQLPRPARRRKRRQSARTHHRAALQRPFLFLAPRPLRRIHLKAAGGLQQPAIVPPVPPRAHTMAGGLPVLLHQLPQGPQRSVHRARRGRRQDRGAARGDPRCKRRARRRPCSLHIHRSRRRCRRVRGRRRGRVDWIRRARLFAVHGRDRARAHTCAAPQARSAPRRGAAPLACQGACAHGTANSRSHGSAGHAAVHDCARHAVFVQHLALLCARVRALGAHQSRLSRASLFLALRAAHLADSDHG
eukprot:comp22423_c0_seq1/m.54858 comp22423_c0_seq1/g.54858  ORF comp22423_c0_seq1/g.54858 comp22423_c0_seq1/m.54858 type:complete len:319 (+) comp22423_c0_seq1:1531-2487(+)